MVHLSSFLECFDPRSFDNFFGVESPLLLSRVVISVNRVHIFRLWHLRSWFISRPLSRVLNYKKINIVKFDSQSADKFCVRFYIYLRLSVNKMTTGWSWGLGKIWPLSLYYLLGIRQSPESQYQKKRHNVSLYKGIFCGHLRELGFSFLCSFSVFLWKFY